MHATPLVTHLQGLWQTFLQEQVESSGNDEEIVGIEINVGINDGDADDLSPNFQPHSVGDGRFIFGCNILPQTALCKNKFIYFLTWRTC